MVYTHSKNPSERVRGIFVLSEVWFPPVFFRMLFFENKLEYNPQLQGQSRLSLLLLLIAGLGV